MNNSKKRYSKKIHRITIDCYLCDDDIIQYLQTKSSVAGFIKQLIRNQIKEDLKHDQRTIH